MAMDPEKLGAFAEGAKPGEDELEAAGHAEDGEAPEGEGDMQEGGPGKFGKLIPLLEAHAEELSAICEELDPAVLTDPASELDEGVRKSLLESVDTLPEDLQNEMIASMRNISAEEGVELATHLEGEGMIDDVDLVGGLLFRIGQVLEDFGQEAEEGGEEGEEQPEQELEDEGEEEYAGEYE
jgi:hypothetical protein